jgi:hypothetical protein
MPPARVYGPKPIYQPGAIFVYYLNILPKTTKIKRGKSGIGARGARWKKVKGVEPRGQEKDGSPRNRRSHCYLLGF